MPRPTILTYYHKALQTIQSCLHEGHLQGADNFITNFKQFRQNSGYEMLHNDLIEQLQKKRENLPNPTVQQN